MTDYQNGYIYCSPLFDVQSLDNHLTRPKSSVFALRDTADSPEIAFLKVQDHARLIRWIGGLPESLKNVAEAIMTGETQASLARREGVSEAAISKRLKRLGQIGRVELAELRSSPLLH